MQHEPAHALPTGLMNLSLDFEGCKNVTDGFKEVTVVILGGLAGLHADFTSLSLDFHGRENIPDENLRKLAHALPSGRTSLSWIECADSRPPPRPGKLFIPSSSMPASGG